MKRALLALTVILAAATAHADSADLQLIVSPYPVYRAGDVMYYNVFVYNAGPDVARNVAVTISTDGLPQPHLPCPGGRCALADIAPNQTGYMTSQFIQTLPVDNFTFQVSVVVTSDTPDPDLKNNSDTRSIRVTTAPRLITSFFATAISEGQPLEPAQPFRGTLTIYNEGYSAAHDIVATVDLPEGTGITSLPANCSSAGLRVTCHIDSIATNVTSLPDVTLPMILVAPPLYEGGPIPFAWDVHAAETDFDGQYTHGSVPVMLPRTLLVTTMADDGAGSLRAIINTANASCLTPPNAQTLQLVCAIAFNIAEPSANPWKTIHLKSPLPPIHVVGLRIDGATQAGFSGVANPSGPSIEISGGGTVDGDGLLIDNACVVTLSGLAINGFNGNGLSFDHATCPGSIINNYIGTDPTGSVAIPNFRGIGSAAHNTGPVGPTISGNVISGNVRSGLFLAGGMWDLHDNRIGLKAHADEPLSNGASGMYVSAEAGRVRVFNNAIAFNKEMGIAIHPLSHYVMAQGNRIWANGGLAIDDGLDGPSASVNTDSVPLNVPVIISASYDPARDETSIRGLRMAGSYPEVFASDAPGPNGAGDAQRLLNAGACSDFPQCQGDNFFVKVKGDLRGQWIAATTSLPARVQPFLDFYTVMRTSELSAAVQVK
jgi:hypothetical protein